MVKTLKCLIIIVSFVVLIYLVSSGNTLVAEDGEREAEENYAGATISVEASSVAVDLEVLEEIIGKAGINSLNSIPLEKIKQCLREDEGEIVSIARLAVRNGSSGEMSREDNSVTKRKISNEGVTEREQRESHVSFRAVPSIIDTTRIAVSFNFKQIVSEGGEFSKSEAEEQEEQNIVFEVSSEVVLRPGQPRIVGAARKDKAMFLIMESDI